MSLLRRIGVNIMAAIPAFIVFGGLHLNNTYNRPVVINEQAEQWIVISYPIQKVYNTHRGTIYTDIIRYELSASITAKKVRQCDFLRAVSYVDVNGVFQENIKFEFQHDDSPNSTRGTGFQGFGRWLWVSDKGLPSRVKTSIFHKCPNITPFLPPVVVETKLEFEVDPQEK